LRKIRFLGVALIATLGIAALAFAQGNTYTINAKVPAGGSKKKPKAVGFTFNFTVADPNGNIPQIIKTYSLGIAGSQVNTKVAKVCTAASINAAQSDSGCSSKSKIGSGSVAAVIGTAGQPMAAKAGDCGLNLTIYNGGTNKAALFLEGGTGKPGVPACPAPISQAIDAKWVKKNGGTALVFDVPDALRHPVPGLDVSVVSTKSTLKKITKKIKGKKRGYFESVGCKGTREVTATYTDETGNAVPVTASAGDC
jgi:hypothetical protein